MSDPPPESIFEIDLYYNDTPSRLVSCRLVSREFFDTLSPLGCPCTLKLWEAQGPRTVTLGNVTFPGSQQAAP
ncbi:hypothetical protein [Archangium lansingense]|uniref:Uncharacterized protein n=1 Tax=Archangium lansingense TaxID=2995310 RepID=A0ABT4ABW4_9BACT|nr:hypothetical protein [Archangium lansinium]MCY1078816.1 hypothetical protein [Archangium lansinium]